MQATSASTGYLRIEAHRDQQPRTCIGIVMPITVIFALGDDKKISSLTLENLRKRDGMLRFYSVKQCTGGEAPPSHQMMSSVVLCLATVFLRDLNPRSRFTIQQPLFQYQGGWNHFSTSCLTQTTFQAGNAARLSELPVCVPF